MAARDADIGSGEATYQPIWAEDVADCAHRVLREGAPDGARRLELAGPEVLTYEEIVRAGAVGMGPRPAIVHLPFWMVRRGLRLLERHRSGPSVFATWEEAELMEVPMVSAAGTGGRAPPRRRAAADGGGAGPRHEPLRTGRQVRVTA